MATQIQASESGNFIQRAAGWPVAATARPNGTTAYAANGLNQMTTAGAANITYDLNGNLGNDGTNIYSYDVLNRLTAMSGVSLSYDAEGRLSGPHLIVALGLEASTSNARRVIEGGGVTLGPDREELLTLVA